MSDKARKAIPEEKNWFELLIQTKWDLERRISKLEERVKHLETENTFSTDRRIGIDPIDT